MDDDDESRMKRAATIPVARRRPRFPDGLFTAEDAHDLTADEWDILNAIDRFKRENRRPFPTWREVVAIFINRGWRRTEAPGAPLPRRILPAKVRKPGAPDFP